MSTLPEPTCPSDSLPGDSLNQCPEQAKVYSPKDHGVGFAGPPLLHHKPRTIIS